MSSTTLEHSAANPTAMPAELGPDRELDGGSGTFDSGISEAEPMNLQHLIDHIMRNRRINRIEQRRLMQFLLSKDRLSSGEQVMVNRIFDALRKGLIQVAE